MKELTKLRLFAACATIVMVLATSASGGQASDGGVAGRSLSLSLNDVYFINVLGTLSMHHRVPIGLEVSADTADEPKLDIEVRDAPLEAILDLIVRQFPAYRWEVRDGVINFVPARSRDAFLAQLLDTRVRSFAPQAGANKFGIRNAILALPEVENLLRINNITAWKLEYQTRRSVYTDDQADLSISDTSVRGVLNKVVRESEHKLWVIQRKGEKCEVLQISL